MGRTWRWGGGMQHVLDAASDVRHEGKRLPNQQVTFPGIPRHVGNIAPCGQTSRMYGY